MSKRLQVLIACECSGTVRDAFTKAGHYAVSCDLLPSDAPGIHYQGDVFDILPMRWDLMIAHPPCTYLTATGNKWFKPEFKARFPDREKKRQEALDFFIALFQTASAHIPKVCCENPVGYVSSMFRKPDQYVQPYEFGDPHSKKTGLWLRGLPPLLPTCFVQPQFHTYKDGRRDPIWHYETMKLKPLERMKARSKTFQGIADAMANQWGGQL
jgi:hypothetical protein